MVLLVESGKKSNLASDTIELSKSSKNNMSMSLVESPKLRENPVASFMALPSLHKFGGKVASPFPLVEFEIFLLLPLPQCLHTAEFFRLPAPVVPYFGAT